MQKGNSSDSGFGHSDPFPAENLVGISSGGLDSFSVPESVVLETNSSFGSTSSSVSVSNLAAMRVHVEDSGVNLQDKKVHLPLSESIERYNLSYISFLIANSDFLCLAPGKTTNIRDQIRVL